MCGICMRMFAFVMYVFIITLSIKQPILMCKIHLVLQNGFKKKLCSMSVCCYALGNLIDLKTKHIVWHDHFITSL